MVATIQLIREELSSCYPPEEIEGLIRVIFRELCGFSLTDLVTKRDIPLPHQTIAHVKEIVRRLKLYEPIQYILGSTHFFGLHLKVTPDVLIPRPETEEMVQLIIGSCKLPWRIADIGTGSGCIALALKHHFVTADVWGFDISKAALKIAHENARLNGLEVRFAEADMLRLGEWPQVGPFDLIVSNPPYVTESEKVAMHPNVVGYEPALALFVNDDDPLAYYRSIAAFALDWLTPQGKLFFEINERFGTEIAAMLRMMGFSHIEVKVDLQGKERMVTANRGPGI